MNVTHQAAGIFSVMHYINSQRKIDLPIEVSEAQVFWAAESRFNSLGKAGVLCFPL